MKKFIVVFSLIFSAIVALANESVKNDSVVYNLDEVTVSSLYRSSVGANNTININTLQEQNHGQGVDYVISTLPNIYAYNDNGLQMGYTYFRMRGMGQERINITYDGIPWNEPEDFGCYFSNSPDLMGSMHSIKVENGASVTNNGSAAYAGNVSLESVNLVTDTLSYAEFGGGSFNTYRTSVVYNMGVKKNWGLHIRATQQQTDGFKENGFNNSQALTFKVGYFFNENHSIDLLSLTGFHRNGQGYLGILKSDIPKHLNPFKQIKSGNRPQETDNFLTTYNRLQYKGRVSSNVFLTSSFYWNAQNGDYRVSWFDDELLLGKALNNYHLVYNMYGLNTTAKWFIKDNLSLVGGVNGYIYTRTHKGYDIANPDSLINIWHTNGAEPFYSNKGTKPDFSAFATLRYSPVNNLNLQGSVQYRTTELRYKVYVPAFEDDVYDKSFNHTWNFINWSVSADYTFNRYNNVYAKYSVTNREPSRTDLFGGEYITNESPLNTQSERAKDIEVGYSFVNKKFNFNANLFYIDFDNELVATGELSPINFLPIHRQINTYRTGVEVTAEYNPFKTFNIILNGSYLKTKLKEYNTQCTFSPNVLVFGEVNYTFNNTIKVGVNTQYRSRMYLDVTNEYYVNPSWTLNAYMNADVCKNVEVSVNLNNLTNRLNMSGGSVDGGDVFYMVDSPFTFFVGVKYKF